MSGGAVQSSVRAFDSTYRRDASCFGERPSDWVRRFAQLAPGDRALDLGCGWGRNAIHLAKTGFHVTGLDVSPAAIRQVRRGANAEHLAVEAVLSDIRGYTFGAGEFDLILGITVFSLLPDGELATLGGRLRSALSEGGILLVEDFAAGDPGCSGRGPASEFARLVRHFFTPGEMEQTFGAGLHTLAMETVAVQDRTHGAHHSHMLERYAGQKDGKGEQGYDL